MPIIIRYTIALILAFALGYGNVFSQYDPDYIVEFTSTKDSIKVRLVQDCRLYTERWDTLPQTRFWQTIMCMPKDTSLINIAKTRHVLGKVRTGLIDSMNREEIEVYKDSIREVYGIDKEQKLYITSGRDFYYKFQDAFADVSPAIDEFGEMGVNPWYAQAILFIESPGRNRRSNVGAYGSFQLMKGVAREMGLTVNRYKDERKDLRKSAGAAAKFIKKVCIPRTKMILDELGLGYHQDDLWFRLLVLHVYHAGYGNVRGALLELKPRWGGPDLIKDLWQTEFRRFGNASQNYSQVILASMVRADLLLTEWYERQCNCCP
ncbi:MAG: transglycosylase SLT domain-containing protein [Bacteroidia bacterium]